MLRTNPVGTGVLDDPLVLSVISPSGANATAPPSGGAMVTIAGHRLTPAAKKAPVWELFSLLFKLYFYFRFILLFSP